MKKIKKLCDFKKKDFEEYKEDIIKIVRLPKYLCKKCLRVAHEKKYLCKVETF